MSTNTFKAPLFAAFICLLCLSANSQTPTWAWAIDTDGAQQEEIWRVRSGTNGTVYALGRFNDSFDFGGVQVGVPAPWQILVYYPFLSKINAEGQVEWIIALGEPEVGYRFNGVFGLAIDSDNNVYIAGQVLRGSAVGNYEVNIAGVSFSPPPSASTDGFIAKIDPDGNGLWVRNLSTSQYPVWARPVVEVDENDHIYLHAYVEANNIEIDGTVYPIMGVAGIVLARLDTNGNIIWFQSMGSEGFDNTASMTKATGGGLLMSSMWTGDSVHVGGLTLVNPDALIGISQDRWIAKIDSSGAAQWLVREGGPGTFGSGLVATTPTGGAMILSHIGLWPITLNGVTYDEQGYLLTRYSNTGELEQVSHYATTMWDGRRAIVGDGNDNYFMGFTSFDPIINFGDFQFDNAGGLSQTSDFFIVAIDGSGTPLWTQLLGSNEFEMLGDLDYSQPHGLLACGYYNSNTLAFGNNTLNNAGMFTYDAFVAALDFTSSITSIPHMQHLHLYPNPAQDDVAVDLSTLSTQQHTLRIFDTRGSLVLSQNVMGGGVETIEVHNLPKGSYVIIIQTNGITYASKFIKL